MKKSYIFGGLAVVVVVAASLSFGAGDLFQGRISRNLNTSSRPTMDRNSAAEQAMKETKRPVSRFFDFFKTENKNRPNILAAPAKAETCESKFGGKWETLIEGDFKGKPVKTDTIKYTEISTTTDAINKMDWYLYNETYENYCFTQEAISPLNSKLNVTELIKTSGTPKDPLKENTIYYVNAQNVNTLFIALKEKLPEAPSKAAVESGQKFLYDEVVLDGSTTTPTIEYFRWRDTGKETLGYPFIFDFSTKSAGAYEDHKIRVTLQGKKKILGQAAPKPDCYSNPYPVQPRNMPMYTPPCDEIPKPYSGPKAQIDHPNLITRGELADLIVSELKKDGIDTSSKDDCSSDTKGHKYGKPMCFLYTMTGKYFKVGTSTISIGNPFNKSNYTDPNTLNLFPDSFIQRDTAAVMTSESFVKLKYNNFYGLKVDLKNNPYSDLYQPDWANLNNWTKEDYNQNFHYERVVTMYNLGVTKKGDGKFHLGEMLTTKDAKEWAQKAGNL